MAERVVNQEEIYVVCAQLAQGLYQRVPDSLPLGDEPKLGRNVELGTRHARCSDALADAVLVFVPLCGVDVAEAGLDCGGNTLVSVLSQECRARPEGEPRDGSAVVQFDRERRHGMFRIQEYISTSIARVWCDCSREDTRRGSLVISFWPLS